MKKYINKALLILMTTFMMVVVGACGNSKIDNVKESEGNDKVIESEKDTESGKLSEKSEEITESQDISDEKEIDYDASDVNRTHEVYYEILENAKTLAAAMSSGGDPSNAVSKSEYTGLYGDFYSFSDTGYKYGYTFLDINEDGIDELLLTVENCITTLYTNIDGSSHKLFEGWARNAYYYIGSGMFYNTGSNGADDTAFLLWKINDAGNDMEFISGVRYYSGQYYKLKINGDTWENGDTISQDEAEKYQNENESKIITLDSINIEEYDTDILRKKESSSNKNNDDKGEDTSQIEKTKDDYKPVAGKTFRVFGSKFALEWSDEFIINNNGGFSGTAESGGETSEVNNYSGTFSKLDHGDDLIYMIYIDEDCGYFKNGTYVTVYDKGFPVSKLPEDVKNWASISKYKSIVSGDSLPCQLLYNESDGSIYAESYFLDQIDNNDIGKSSDSSKSPFYGIWCYASKTSEDAESIKSSLVSSGLDAKVFVSSDWSNLNAEKYYVVTAGTYATEDEANANLSKVQSAGYSDAYVKYSGDYIGIFIDD